MPVLANEREQAVLNLVPLAGAGWEVTNDDVEPARRRRVTRAGCSIRPGLAARTMAGFKFNGAGGAEVLAAVSAKKAAERVGDLRAPAGRVDPAQRTG